MSGVRAHIQGYAGHIPGQITDNLVHKTPVVPGVDLPGYAGYVFAIKPENIYGKTFSRLTSEVKKENSYYRNRPHFDDNWNTISRENYKDPAKVDGSHNMVPTRKVKTLKIICKKFKVWRSWDVDHDNYYAAQIRERTAKLV